MAPNSKHELVQQTDATNDEINLLRRKLNLANALILSSQNENKNLQMEIQRILNEKEDLKKVIREYLKL